MARASTRSILPGHGEKSSAGPASLWRELVVSLCPQRLYFHAVFHRYWFHQAKWNQKGTVSCHVSQIFTVGLIFLPITGEASIIKSLTMLSF
jgi:hypothetical protein